MTIKVKALRRGWYGTLREPGAEFDIADEKHLGNWMQVLGDKPKQESEAPKAKDLIAAIEDSDDVEFITEQLESSFKSVVTAAEKRIAELQG